MGTLSWWAYQGALPLLRGRQGGCLGAGGGCVKRALQALGLQLRLGRGRLRRLALRLVVASSSSQVPWTPSWLADIYVETAFQGCNQAIWSLTACANFACDTLLDWMPMKGFACHWHDSGVLPPIETAQKQMSSRTACMQRPLA